MINFQNLAWECESNQGYLHTQIPAQNNHGTNLANIPCYQVANFPNPMCIGLKTIWSKLWIEK